MQVASSSARLMFAMLLGCAGGVDVRESGTAGNDNRDATSGATAAEGGTAGASDASGSSERDAAAMDARVGQSSDAAAPRADASTTAGAGSDAQVATDPSAPLPASNGQWVLGYYAAYQRDMLPPDQVDWAGLSHLVVTRLKTDGSGRVLRDMDVDPTNGPILAKDLSTRAHQNGRKALLLLGGAGAGTTIKNSSSDANRANFVSGLLTATKELGYDGLDLDWEDDIDYDRFIALVRDLRASPLAPPGLILIVGGYPINGNFQTVDPKIVQLARDLDRYNLMTYFPATAQAGGGWLSWHNCPLTGRKSNTPVTIEDSLDRYVKAGIPKAKLGLGVAFYAICYTGSVTAPNQSTEGGVTIQGGDNDYPLSRLFASGGPFNPAHRKWDMDAQVPYLSLPTAESHGCRYVSFDDEQSLEAKGAFSRRNGYGGIVVWTINQGYLRNSSKPANALTQALKRGFLDP